MKILIWGEVKNGGPYDIKRRLDYSRIYEELNENYHANCMNVGNKVWIQGLISELSTNENDLFFYNPNETWEEINSKYDKIVYSAANMFSRDYVDLIDSVASLFRKSKIPVYTGGIVDCRNIEQFCSEGITTVITGQEYYDGIILPQSYQDCTAIFREQTPVLLKRLFEKAGL